MARRLLAKATTAALAGAVLLSSEIVFDETLDRPVIGDGVTLGGKPLALLADLGGLKVDATAGNVVLGGPATALTGAAAGAHDGDSNIIISATGAPNATTLYASTFVGAGAGAASLTNHSDTGFGYQALHNQKTGYMNLAAGVDAAYLCENIRWSVVLGHHCANGVNAAHQGVIVIGQQTMRYAPALEYQNVIGRNAMANSHNTAAYPTWGASGWSDVIGGTAAISASVLRSQLFGFGIVQQNNAAVVDASLTGYFNHYGFKTVTGTVSKGAYGFFLSNGDGATRASEYNSGLGFEHGYNVWGADNVFVGRRAAWHAAAREVNGAVCIGPYAGFNRVNSGDLFIANADTDGATLISGNFLSQVLKLRANHLTLVDLPAANDDAAAAAAGVAVGELYHNAGALRRRVA